MKVRVLVPGSESWPGRWPAEQAEGWNIPDGYNWEERQFELVRFDDIFGFEDWIMADFFLPQTDAWIFI